MKFRPAIWFFCAVGPAILWAALANSATASPYLNISTISNRTVLINWPAQSADFILQESDALAPASWQSSLRPIVTNNGTFSVVISITNTAHFFRLISLGQPVSAGNYISNGLMAYWKFNDGGGTIAEDFSGSGINLPLIGFPAWGSNYLALDGSTQYGNAGSNALKSLDQHDKTICAWINKTANSQKAIVDKSFNMPGVASGGWGFWVQSDGRLMWTVRANQEFYDNGFAGVSLGSWTFVTVVWHSAATSAEFYINGLLHSIVNNGGAPEQSSASADLQVGNYGNNSSDGTFDGSIREVGIYNRALSAAEIQTNFLMTELATNVIFPSLLYYKMTENAQTNPPVYLADSSTHGGTTGTALTATDLQWISNQGSIPGAALHFNGVSTYIDTGNASLFNFTTNSFSINLWLNPLTANGYVLANGFYHGVGWFMSVGSSYQVNFGADTFGADNVLTTIGPVSGWPGIYNMVTITRHGTGTPLIYINGILTATTGSFVNPASSGESLIVGTAKTSANYLDGDIWMLQIWNTELTPDDVANLYFNQTSGIPWP